MDTRDAQLRRAVRKACNRLKRIRSAAVVRFLECHVVELEKQLRMGDQHIFCQSIKLVQLEERTKVESQCVRDEEGKTAARQRAYPQEGCDSSARGRTLNPTCSIPTSRRGCRSIQSRVPSGSSPRRGDCHSDEGNGKRESGVPESFPRNCGNLDLNKTGPSCWSSIGFYHFPLARGESPIAVERRGHYRTPQEGHQDGVRKLPRYLARVARG